MQHRKSVKKDCHEAWLPVVSTQQHGSCSASTDYQFTGDLRRAITDKIEYRQTRHLLDGYQTHWFVRT